MKFILERYYLLEIIKIYFIPLIAITFAFLLILLTTKKTHKRKTKKYYREVNFICALYGLFMSIFLTAFSIYFSAVCINEIINNNLENKMVDVYGSCYLFPFISIIFLVTNSMLIYIMYKRPLRKEINKKEIDKIIDGEDEVL